MGLCKAYLEQCCYFLEEAHVQFGQDSARHLAAGESLQEHKTSNGARDHGKRKESLMATHFGAGPNKRSRSASSGGRSPSASARGAASGGRGAGRGRGNGPGRGQTKTPTRTEMIRRSVELLASKHPHLAPHKVRRTLGLADGATTLAEALTHIGHGACGFCAEDPTEKSNVHKVSACPRRREDPRLHGEFTDALWAAHKELCRK